MPAAAPNRLKLKVADLQDMILFAPLLQDAILRLRDMRFLAGQHRFVAVANRLRWEEVTDAARAALLSSRTLSEPAGDAAFEDAEPGNGLPSRQHMGLCFEQVTRVESRNLPSDRNSFFTLLTITAQQDSATLHFAGGAAIRLHYRKLALFGEDLGESWPTFYLPDHEAEGATLV